MSARQKRFLLLTVAFILCALYLHDLDGIVNQTGVKLTVVRRFYVNAVTMDSL